MMIDLRTFAFGGLASVFLLWAFLFSIFNYPLMTMYILVSLTAFVLGGWYVLNLVIDQPLNNEENKAKE